LIVGASLAAAAASAPIAALAAADAFDPAQYRGKVVYLDFWASWCAPCRLSFPYMSGLSARYATRPFAVVAVNVDHSQSQAEQFLGQFGRDVRIVFDPAGKLATRFGVKEMPTSFLLDKAGKVRFVHDGFHEDMEFEYDAHVAELISE
jgi:thiol-disulfide isomerase/thioredoxin